MSGYDTQSPPHDHHRPKPLPGDDTASEAPAVSFESSAFSLSDGGPGSQQRAATITPSLRDISTGLTPQDTDHAKAAATASAGTSGIRTPVKNSVQDDFEHDGTPRSVKVGGNVTHKQKEQHAKLADEEMRLRFASLPVDKWFDVCLAGGDPSQEDFDEIGDFSLVPSDDSNETHLYPGICDAMNKVFKRCGSRYALYVTGFNPEDGKNNDMKPDLCMYQQDGPGRSAFTVDKPAGKGKRTKKDRIDGRNKEAVGTHAAGVQSGGEVAGAKLLADVDEAVDEANEAEDEGRRVPERGVKEQAAQEGEGVSRGGKKRDPDWRAANRLHQARVAWAWITMLIEVKTDKDQTPYEVTDDGRVILAPGDSALSARDQIIRYASEVMLRQHRKFVYTAMIVQNRAFLMRWDRTGALVARPFDYKKEPHNLIRFAYRIACAEPSLQGYDPTVVFASSQEKKMFSDYADGLEAGYLRTYAKDVVDNDLLFPIMKVTCPDATNLSPCDQVQDEKQLPQEPSRRTYAFLMGKYCFGSRSPTGRGTKAFFAFDVDRGRLAFLKDYWYGLHKTIHPETKVYERLRQAKVRFVATLIAGGDVEEEDGGKQDTTTQAWLPEGTGRPLQRRHHRFVVKEIGRPLESYTAGYQMVLAVHQALLAHSEAWSKAHILHRDVSVGNILIDVATDTAFLNDWDLCKYEEELMEAASQHDRSGTWWYMSAALVQFPRKPNRLPDDIESFLHVISVMLLRFHNHNKGLAYVQADDEGLNLVLSEHFNSLYDTAYKTKEGYYVSTGQKLEHVKRGDPGFFLMNPDTHTRDTTSNLAELLEKLWTLGRQHYVTYDLDDMQKRWGVSMPVSQKKDVRKVDVTKLRNSLLRPREQTDADAESPGSSASSSHVPTPSTSSVRRDNTGGFHSHGPMLQIFESLSPYWDADDKTSDHFQSLRPLAPSRPAGTMGGSKKRPSQEPSNNLETGSGPKRARMSEGSTRSRSDFQQISEGTPAN